MLPIWLKKLSPVPFPSRSGPRRGRPFAIQRSPASTATAEGRGGACRLLNLHP